MPENQLDEELRDDELRGNGSGTQEEIELTELESEDMTDNELLGIQHSQREPDTADPDNPEVS
jgi:hypothetical protein